MIIKVSSRITLKFLQICKQKLSTSRVVLRREIKKEKHQSGKMIPPFKLNFGKEFSAKVGFELLLSEKSERNLMRISGGGCAAVEWQLANLRFEFYFIDLLILLIFIDL